MGVQLTVNEAITRLTRATPWVTVDRIPLDFACHHPQGLDRVGENFFLSSAEILEATVRHEHPEPGGPDRTAGKGVGHLYEMDPTGRMLREWTLGEDTIYHPSGLTFDGEHVWVPTAEYRPDSRSIMYRIDPVTGDVTEDFRYPDHLGGVSRDPGTGQLYGITWGGRRILELTSDGALHREVPVRSHYVDFQDCVEMADGLASWTGIAEYPDGSGGVFQLGGIALLDMATGDIKHEVPVTVLSPAGRVVTFNATHIEVVDDRLRMYAVPDDGERLGDSSLLVLEAEIS
ncbi:DUF6454 family protein [Streptomyces sp. NPDC046909]|uniref:DUF6454 family protein n=1 Tax=Streptomyces sp. NPDC046909 TaxID=3155617 RepID=UPI0033D556EA